MQLIITDAWFMKGRTVYVSGPSLAMAVTVCVLFSVLLAIGFSSFVLGQRLISVPAQAQTEQNRVVRENLNVMARQMGELSAKLTQVEALSERVVGLVGLTPADVKASARGGPLLSFDPVVPSVLAQALRTMDQRVVQQKDLMTVLESRLIDDKSRKMRLPTQFPVVDHAVGSPFGWRQDPFTGQTALHTGLDFPAEPGTSVVAAAGGWVIAQEYHPAYGNLLEIDHGNEVVTRYAHLARSMVKKGDLIKRGQRIGDVGNTGRSTGPHLHFEVLVQGAFQDPALFLTAGQRPVDERAPVSAQAVRP